jgi:hypothetical protein
MFPSLFKRATRDIAKCMKALRATLIVACFFALAACDPGYEYTIHNPCDTPVSVDFRDSDQFGQSGTGGAVTISPHSTSSWSRADPDISPPFGVLLLDGPRAGELIKSESPDMAIPKSACPR